MINKYEARLGTERMLPLVFKMALPAVIAQFVNLLYSMVDRIYIGHIPGIGTDALAANGAPPPPTIAEKEEISITREVVTPTPANASVPIPGICPI